MKTRDVKLNHLVSCSRHIVRLFPGLTFCATFIEFLLTTKSENF